MNAHKLEFPDNSFDVVYGGGILHHLDFETALSEARRVLKPGGLMVFAEPLDMNPIGRLVRALTPQARTEDETPLRMKHLRICQRFFSMNYHYLQFFSVPAGVLSGLISRDADNILTRSAYALDEALLRIFPRIGPFYRHVLLVGEKRK